RSASMWKSSWARTVQQPADGGADTPSLRTPRPHQTGPPARLRLLLTIDSPLSTRLFQKLCGAKSTERPLRMGPRDCRYLGSGRSLRDLGRLFGRRPLRVVIGAAWGVERGGEGLALIIDTVQEGDRSLGAIDQAVAVRQEADGLFVLGQGRGQLRLALLEV